MPRTVMHVGVHKTATTFIQRKLAMNVEQLAARGVYYLPLDVLRKNFTACISNFSANEILDELKAACKTKTVIISDENIVGAPGDIIRSGMYYPNIKKRLRAAQDILETKDIELYVSFREYSSFIVSMYCEFIRHREYMDFEDYFASCQKSEFSWRKVMSDIRRSAPHAKISFWDYGNFHARESTIFSEMIGYDAASLQAPAGRIRESFSAVTLKALGALHGRLEPSLIKKLIQPISRSFPKGPDFPAFEPLSNSQIVSFRKAYVKDLEAIAKEHRDIRFL